MESVSRNLDARTVARTLEPLVNTVLMATAYAQAERERINAIQSRVLAEDVYLGMYREDGQDAAEDERSRVTDPAKTWEMIDAHAKRFYARLHEIYTGMGYELDAPGYCPACIAERLQTEAEWALIEAAEQFFPGVTNNKLLCGIKGKDGLTLRREYLDLLCKIVVNAPGYTAPKLPAA